MSAQGQSRSRNFQQGSCCCSTIFRKMSPTCLQGWGCQLLSYLIWVKPSSTTDDNNPPYDSLLCRFGTDGINICIIVDVLSESYNWSQNKNILIWFPEKGQEKKYLRAQCCPTCNCSKEQKRQQPDVFGWLRRTRQRTYHHRQQTENLRLKMLRAQLTLASSSFICSDTDNSICFLWTAGGRFDSTHCIYHFLFLRLYCRPNCCQVIQKFR